MDVLQNILLQHNHYTILYQHSFEVLLNTLSIDLEIQLLADPSTDLQQYNIPPINKLAIILPRDNTCALNPHDIVLHKHNECYAQTTRIVRAYSNVSLLGLRASSKSLHLISVV